MKKLLLLASVFFIMLLNSCSATIPGLPGSKNYTITHTQKKSEKYNLPGNVRITYKDYVFVINEEKAILDSRMASAKEVNSVLRTIPKGGYAYIAIKRGSIGLANTKYFEFILKENRKEILRERGSNDIADVPIRGGGMWRNSHIVIFPKPITDKMTLYVVDLATGTRDEFIISKK